MSVLITHTMNFFILLRLGDNKNIFQNAFKTQSLEIEENSENLEYSSRCRQTLIALGRSLLAVQESPISPFLLLSPVPHEKLTLVVVGHSKRV